MEKNLISLVIPVFEEETIIYENIITVKNILEANEINYEFIIVDDGSKDYTWVEIGRLKTHIINLKAYRLSRNFGKEAALCAGLEMASGDAVIVMDADLQHPPEVIPQMIKLWEEQSFEVVDGVKKSRGREKTLNFLSAGLFYKLLDKFSGINLKNASDFKLMDAKVVDAWRMLPEKDTFFRAMSFWVGFRRTSLEFEVAERTAGKSKWSVISLLKLAITAITSFSSIPLHLVSFLGSLFLIGSFALGIHTLYMKFSGAAVSGFTTVILLLLIIGSTLMISLGIIGEYISRIYNEVKRRPRYIISEEISNKKDN
ncbi:MAG: glycosyltransferase family 2 protein [Clostridia bacterium]|nr:glycosyltransferase family 2 protein [Clostridia bacterium]